MKLLNRLFSSSNILILLIVLFVYLSIQTAWLSDDCYITLRTVRNFVEGEGMRWNLDERVQVYTHPLWMLLLSLAYFFTKESYFTTIFLSLILAVLAVGWGLKKLTISNKNLLVGVLACCVSRAFLDYTSSGLENPLSYFLLILWAIPFFKDNNSLQNLGYLSLVSALLMCNRMDASLLVFPAITYYFFQVNASFLMRAKTVFIGFLPILAWLIFAFIYYGFPFPNTAYAKLYTGISTQELLFQGFCYFLVLVSKDAITLFFILLVIFFAILQKEKKSLFFLMGILLYFAYILKIGGDFMMGRFFSLPYFMAILAFVRMDVPQIISTISPFFASKKRWIIGIILFCQLALCFLTDRPTLFNSPAYVGSGFYFGIADERGAYFPFTGLTNVWRKGQKEPDYVGRRNGERLAAYFPQKVCTDIGMGMTGYFAAKDIHIIDQFALTDALLARMKSPFCERPMWRIGHFERFIPQGYIETIESGQNQIQDSALSSLYNTLKIITQEAIFSKKRWACIYDYYTGKYTHQMGISFPKDQSYISPKQLMQAATSQNVLHNKQMNNGELQPDSSAFFKQKLHIEAKNEAIFYQRSPNYAKGIYDIRFSLKIADNTTNDTVALLQTKLGVYDDFSPLQIKYIKASDFSQKDQYQQFHIQTPYSFDNYFLLAFEIQALSQEGIDCEYIRCEKVK